ncbi:inner membrane-spanning protein YciB [Rickettsiales bacterium LUAb2]
MKKSNLLNLLNLSLELIPVILFFIGSIYSIFLATALLMVGSIASIIIYYMLNHKIPMLTVALAILALVFGALTLIFHDEKIIKIKVTVLDLLIAFVFFSAAYWKKNIIEPFTPKIARRPSIFVVINNLWGIFFVFVAILNEIIWRNFSTEKWVLFKVFGIMALVIIFALLQMVGLLIYALLRKQRIDKKRNSTINKLK